MTSRNRPRSGVVKEEMGDELNLWNTIVEKIKGCQKLNEKFENITSGVPAIEKQMQSDGASAKESIARLEELENIQREGVKLAEEELRILNEDPENLLQNLETLISVASAFEAEPPAPKINTNPKPRPKRKMETDGANDSPVVTPDTATPVVNSASRQMSKNVSRSGSVAATSAKSENGTAEAEQSVKPVASSAATEKPLARFAIGTEVFYRKKSSDGAGILCKVTKIKGEGKQKRYEILDTEPEPDTVPETVSPLSLVAIPPPGTAVHEIAKSQPVFALYPETSTFYRAEVVSIKGTKKDHCRLRFEGEEEKGKEQEVERRYVLDVKKCEKQH